MSVKAIAEAPIILALSKPDVTEDNRGNRVIQSVVRVFFPTVDKLNETIAFLKKEQPAPRLQCMWKTVDDRMNVAKSVIFASGVDGARRLVEQESGPPPNLRGPLATSGDIISNLNAKLDFHENQIEEILTQASVLAIAEPEAPKTAPEFYPTIIAILGISLKNGGGVPLVAAQLRICLVGEDDLIPMKRAIHAEDSKAEVEIHLSHTQDSIETAGDFMKKELAKSPKQIDISSPSNLSKSTDSLASAFNDDYF
jgi:hypothetical protein